MIALTEDKSMMGYEALAEYPDVYGFTTTRRGGFSKGNYASFNCSPYTGDDPECVRRNQELLCQSMPQRPKELVIPFQTHSSNILVIDEKYVQASAEERTQMLQGVDALITREPGYCLCVSTADCLPILLYDRKNKVVAAVHAGWRGTLDGIITHTLNQMSYLYGTEGSEVTACVGPGISMSSFEVGEEVYEEFRKRGHAMDIISKRIPDTDKYLIDLSADNRRLLMDFGLSTSRIAQANVCTYINHDEYFSARRLGIKSGRMLSGIMIK